MCLFPLITLVLVNRHNFVLGDVLNEELLIRNRRQNDVGFGTRCDRDLLVYRTALEQKQEWALKGISLIEL